MFVVVRVDSGILEGVALFEDREKALRFGQHQFEEASCGCSSMAQAQDRDAAEMRQTDPDYDERWGGVARGFVMHWLTEDVDVWVTEPTRMEGG